MRNMDADKVKIIIMNIELLLKELKEELKDTLKDEKKFEYTSPIMLEYDEVFDE